VAILLVAYDLNDPGQSHEEVLGYIEGYEHVALSESAYAIETDESPKAVYDGIRWWLDDNDRFYVVPLRGPGDGQGPEDDALWLKDRLP
jgi:hypothetical protein